MILDNNAIVSDQQAITATANSTNTYDLLALGKTYQGTQLRRNLAIEPEIPFLIQVNETFNNLTSLAFVFQNDDDSAFGSADIEVFRLVVPLSRLKKGYILPIDELPRGMNKRYFRMRYEVTGTAPTTGKVTAAAVASTDGAYQGNNPF